MNFKFILTFLFAFIICTENKISTKKVFKKASEKLEKDIFNLEITEVEKDIILNVRSKNFFPISATWYSESDVIDSGNFQIEGNDIYSWMVEKVTNKDSLALIINNLEQNSFVFKTDKQNFGTKKRDLKCLLELLKKEDYEKIMNEYWNDIEKIDEKNPLAVFSVYSEIFTKINEQKKYFGIEYSNNTDEMPNLNDYEIFQYECSINEKKSYSDINLLKKCAIDTLKNSLLTVGVFGGIICAVRMSLSNYF
ncbi:hypothetical protein NBO_67g0013 [Nosema bombycis CQ1]|uniref:Uncharacterized protein n=1 Tax=Nosema bombycis (strain CQ1 / CVCC 102059) TaxID=578461 RepID=R0ML51_NOSB1|nr:hypothetical protein NBO_67g0013 [Nosema bombycis CQ1]|eukprot:EOB13538.1 hypothetical protein NBO_67g0013 [Nosema bombycis CQ1]